MPPPLSLRRNMPPKGAAYVAAAQEALEAKAWDKVLQICKEVPMAPNLPYPLLVCRGMAAAGLQDWEVSSWWHGSR